MPNMAVVEEQVLALRQRRRVGVRYLEQAVEVVRLATVQEEHKGQAVLGVHIPQAAAELVAQMVTLAPLVVMA